MIDKIKYIVQNAVKKAVYREPEIPDGKKQITADIAADSLTDSIDKYLKKIALASPPTTQQPNTKNNSDVLSGIKSKTVAMLISKAGLDPQVAQKLTESAMDAIMKIMPGGTNNSDSLFSLPNQNSGSGKGILESIGNIFNKNR